MAPLSARRMRQSAVGVRARVVERFQDAPLERGKSAGGELSVDFAAEQQVNQIHLEGHAFFRSVFLRGQHSCWFGTGEVMRQAG
ncbi:hypothetical protein M3I54_37830 [Paraburkholderia sp. CNPSo 3274]|uniref:hypothetical protein n=1 Tax=Paraburkholderia sp. CNPSo 3274 TaxID=2940932 RepID=UPI0020B878E7|nr:hypothetical protein [Paraburkholderia sp. CNPSo 3274]MCP3712615.1 hypothetical protein [Paraburkholderia sp. CNPSo 3274]